MFEVPTITPEVLSELGSELSGCDFSDKSQTDFLANTGTCDVQAAPGNGKTTLLAAKLALLSRSWTNRRQGVCVLSHTNAARTEVENLIAKHPTAAQLMAYPHFTGTVTAFVNQYLALPYLRGLGWCVRQIDDDAFAAEALLRYESWRALDWLANKATHGSKNEVERWVAGLDLDPDFTDDGPAPTTLTVRQRKRQHGPDTNCGKALAELKAAMVRLGLYRYADMTALAWRALKSAPELAERLRRRFPLVILDEAQDTHGEQLQLLEYLFKHDCTAFQRLGDSNQTLYEDEARAPAYWTPGTGCIPLDTSRRFGSEIAAFASRLTMRKAQSIVGTASHPTARVLFLFDEATIGCVIGAFANEARAHWGDACKERDIWAVASRHNIPSNKKGGWKLKSLIDYYPAYRGESGSREKANLFCRQLQKAAAHHAAERPPAEVVEMLATGVTGLARAYRWKAPNGRPITAQNVWAMLAHHDLGLPGQVRRLLRDHILVGNAAWDEQAWHSFLTELLPLFEPHPDEAAEQIADYCGFVAERANPAARDRQSTKQVRIGDVTVRMGSIHSVKGKTVDGILVLESEVWKGAAAKDQCMDLAIVLPHAFGLTNQAFTGVGLTAATNVFVGVTRPRELLGLAVRKAAVTAPLIAAAEEQGWKLVDLVAAPGDAAL